MNKLQKFFIRILPNSWARDLETESRLWMVRCQCGFERSIWDLGGIRWKAKGTPKLYRKCPQCDRSEWHSIYKKTAEEDIL